MRMLRPCFFKLLFTLSFINSCSNAPADRERVFYGSANQENGEMVSVSATMETAGQKNGFHLNLETARNISAYQIQIENCLLREDTVLTESAPSALIMQNDSDCVATLTTFTLNDVVYTISESDPFETNQTGDQATFVAADTAAEETVTIIDPLVSDNVIDGSLSFGVGWITVDDDAEVWNNLGDVNGNLRIGKPLPLRMSGIILESLAADGQHGSVRAALELAECHLEANGQTIEVSELVPGGFLGDSRRSPITCNDSPLADWEFRFVEDVWGSSVPSAAELEAIFAESQDITAIIRRFGILDISGPGMITPKRADEENKVVFIVRHGSDSYHLSRSTL